MNIKNERNIIIQEIKNEPKLQGLNLQDATSEPNLWVNVFAFSSGIIKDLFILHKKEVTTMVTNALIGRSAWYRQQLFTFQKDSILEINDQYIYGYNTVDIDKQIIRSVSTHSLPNGKDIFYIAKYNGTHYEKLTDVERTQAQAYLSKIKIPGTWVEIDSINADVLNFERKIVYSTEYAVTEIKTLLQQAIDNYLNDIHNDIVFTNLNLDIALSKVPGVVNIERVQTQAKTDNGTYSNINEYYTPLSGYLSLDNSFSINNNITLVPYE